MKIIDGNRTLYFDENNALHREDAPAIEDPDWSVSWYKHGVRHREDGPAIIYSEKEQWWFDKKFFKGSFQVWYRDDKIHREDGPAVEGSDGSRYWYLDGKEYPEENFYRIKQLLSFT